MKLEALGVGHVFVVGRSCVRVGDCLVVFACMFILDRGKWAKCVLPKQ